MGITRMGILGKSRGIREDRNEKSETRNSKREEEVEGGMKVQGELANRREFLQRSAAALALTGIPGAKPVVNTDGAEPTPGAKRVAVVGGMQDAAFAARQEERRKEWTRYCVEEVGGKRSGG